MNNLLQYKISSWDQLSKCQSNNSVDLSIKVRHFVNSTELNGTNVSVIHKDYGTLLSYTIFPQGEMITDITKDDIPKMTSEILLDELKRYGFYIVYEEESHLPLGQVDLLKTLAGLKFDKIRILSIHDISDVWEDTIRVTAFSIERKPNWLNSGYSPSVKERREAILDGSAFNVSGLPEAKKYDWSFLYNSIQDIHTLIDENDGRYA